MHSMLAILCKQVCIDLTGPLPTTVNGNKYVVTLVDYFSKWPEAVPLNDVCSWSSTVLV